MSNKHKAIILKSVLEKNGTSLSDFADNFRKYANCNFSRSSAYNLLNTGIMPKKIPKFKETIEAFVYNNFKHILEKLKISKTDIWNNLIDNQEEFKMQKCEILSTKAMENFKLQRDPFVPIYTKEKEILMLQSHYNALENMRITAELGLMTAITGEVGSGKSTVRIKFKSIMRNAGKSIIIQPDTQEINRITSREILEAILRKLSEEKPKRNLESLTNQVKNALINIKNQGIKCILILEEAQDLHTHTLKRLKRLWEMRDEDDDITSLITIIMIGQTELAYRLYGSQNTNLREVASRVTHVELGSINHELYEYFQHKFKIAGVNIDKVITRDAVIELANKFTKKDVNGKLSYIAYPNEMNNIMKKLLNIATNSGEEIINIDTIELAGI